MARKQSLPTGLYVVGKTFYMDFTDPSAQRHRKSLKTEDRATAEAIFKKEREHLIAVAHGVEEKDSSIATFRDRYRRAAKLVKSARVLGEDERRLDMFFKLAGVSRRAAVRPEHFTKYAEWRLGTKTPGEKPVKRSTVIPDLLT